jgi:hypothetical protein
MPDARRELRPAEVEVWAWSLAEPTRLVTGTTVELSIDRAVIRLRRLSAAAEHLTVRLALPGQALAIEAAVVGRKPPDLVSIRFTGLDPGPRERLAAFLENG